MKNILIFLAFIIVLYGCNDDDNLNPEVLPIAQTLYPENLTSTGAILTGKIITGGAKVIKCGFTYAHITDESLINEETDNIDIHNFLSEKGTKVEASPEGDFVYLLENLQKENNYCVEAYVETGVGISYGNAVFFTSSREVSPTVSISSEYILEEEKNVVISCMINAVGGGEITERGIVWDFAADPTLETAEKIMAENGYGAYTIKKNDLEKLRKYYFRAYAKNSFGVSYSNNLMVAIMADVFVDKRDNQSYKVKQYGNSFWMTENFRHIPPGGINNEVWVQGYEGSDTEEAKKSKYYASYGCLYSYEKAVELAPEGWHLATDEEWKELEILTGLTEEEAGKEDEWRGSSNNRLKSEYWEGIGSWNNEMEFNIHPAGKQWCGGAFQNLNELAFFWTATIHPAKENPYYRFFSGGTGTGRFSDFPACVGTSIRYVMD